MLISFQCNISGQQHSGYTTASSQLQAKYAAAARIEKALQRKLSWTEKEKIIVHKEAS